MNRFNKQELKKLIIRELDTADAMEEYTTLVLNDMHYNLEEDADEDGNLRGTYSTTIENFEVTINYRGVEYTAYGDCKFDFNVEIDGYKYERYAYPIESSEKCFELKRVCLYDADDNEIVIGDL